MNFIKKKSCFNVLYKVAIMAFVLLIIALVSLLQQDSSEHKINKNTKTSECSDFPLKTGNNTAIVSSKDQVASKSLPSKDKAVVNISQNLISVEDLPGFSDFDLEILASIAVPYDKTVKDAGELIKNKEYDKAIQILTHYKELAAFKTHTTYIDRLLTKAKALKIWESLPFSEIEALDKELQKIDDQSSKIAFLKEQVNPNGNFNRSLAAIHHLKAIGDENAIVAILNLRAAYGKELHMKNIKYEKSDFSQDVDVLFMGNTNVVGILTKLYRNINNFGSTETSWEDITLASWLSFTQSEETRKALLTIAKDENEQYQKRYHALWVIGRMYGDDAAKDIASFMENGLKNNIDEKVLEAAAVAIGYTGSDVVLETAEKLVPSINNQMRKKLLISALKTFHIREGDYTKSSNKNLYAIRDFFVRYSADMRGK